MTLAADLHIAMAAEALGTGYRLGDGLAVHGSAVIESGAVLKPPVIVGPGCFIAAQAYLRGGVWLEEACTIGPGCEVKSSLLFRGARLAHFNYVGDSVLGEEVNLEAGAVIANHRNEAPDLPLILHMAGETILLGPRKFGALVGDHTRIGANAVIAPGAVLQPRTIVPRLGLVDQQAQ